MEADMFQSGLFEPVSVIHGMTWKEYLSGRAEEKERATVILNHDGVPCPLGVLQGWD